jgi:hypothetical protein
LSILSVGQAKVPITTINIRPTNAAIGISEIIETPNTINNIKNIAAEAPEVLPLHPLEILIIDCPIIAQPPIDWKNPQTKFANP